MIEPVTSSVPPLSLGAAIWAARKSAVRLTSMTASHSSFVMLASGLTVSGMPALLK